jgi:7-keto-8-aminopelargonate synthetase-like enzyme
MIEGIGRSGCDKQIFRHNDVAHIEALLQASGARPKLIVFESLYSMDGDGRRSTRFAISPTSVGGRQNDC